MSELPELFEHQENFLDDVANLASPARACLFFKTGSGKSLTAMLGMKKLGYTDVLVICPPATHLQWEALATSLDMTILCMSHAKFRMKTVRVSRHQAIIADEFHLFGGQQGKGWQKLDTLARHLQAPLFLLSATPNYNDAERCYCIQHVLHPQSCSGGYLQFIYTNCSTEQNPFGMEPKVTGFLKFKDAAEFLSNMTGVYHLPDDLVINIVDIPYKELLPVELVTYNYDRRQHKMVASIMEARHTARWQGLVGEDGYLRPDVLTEVLKVMLKSKTILIYCNHATIAEVVRRSLERSRIDCALVTGQTPKTVKDKIIANFLLGRHNVLIGTATLATGTDGMDRVCDTLLILDDTDDDALRRQLIGRIMPRGDFVSAAAKQVFRLLPV